jgi:hypothetical protein
MASTPPLMLSDDTMSSLDESKEKPDNAMELSTNPTTYPQGIRLLAILTSLILSVFLVSLDRTIIATAIPSITDEFHSLNRVGCKPHHLRDIFPLLCLFLQSALSQRLYYLNNS